MTVEEIKAAIEVEGKQWTELHEKHFAGLTDMEMIVLKGHLLVERLLTALLLHHCHTPAALRKLDLSFYKQMLLVKAMISPSFPDECWEWIELINRLRNDIAHELEPPKLKERLKKVRAIVEPHMRTAPDEFQSKFDTDEDRVKVLISLCMAYLSTFDSILRLQKKSENVSRGA